MNELENVRSGVVFDEQEINRAVTIDNNCKLIASNLRENQRQFAINLSYMRSDKLFLILGYTDFHDYCKKSLNLGASQADKYAMVGIFIRKLELSQSTGSNITFCNLFNDLGIEKMSAVASLDLGDYKYISDKFDLLSMSAKEVRKAVKQFQLDEKQKENHGFLGTTAEYQDNITKTIDEFNSDVSDEPELPDVPEKYYTLYQAFEELKSMILRVIGIGVPFPNRLDSWVETISFLYLKRLKEYYNVEDEED